MLPPGPFSEVEKETEEKKEKIRYMGVTTTNVMYSKNGEGG